MGKLRTPGIWDDLVPRWKYISLKSMYNITIDEYMDLVDQQQNLCAICGKPEVTIDGKSGKTKMLAVDHHHESGRIRGLLYHKCNIAIGMFQEDLRILRNAITYLQYN